MKRYVMAELRRDNPDDVRSARRLFKALPQKERARYRKAALRRRGWNPGLQRELRAERRLAREVTTFVQRGVVGMHERVAP